MSAGAVVAALVVLVTLPNLVGTGQAREADALRTADLTGVTQAINASVSITELPSNLTPALDAAMDDRSRAADTGCLLDFDETEQANCLYGDPKGDKTMVLIGDSHADQWFTPLEQQASAHGFKLHVWTKSACPIADVAKVWSEQLKREYSECTSWRTDMQERMRRLNPDVIVASQSDHVVWDSISDAEWGQATVAGLRKMSGTNSRIVHFQDTPYVGDDPIACLQENISDASKCAVPVGDAFQIFPHRHSAVRSAVETADFQFVDTLPFFCTDTCPAVVGNMTVRRDAGHMTNTYAAWLSPVLAPIFEEQS
jgi:hypothetical protein